MHKLARDSAIAKRINNIIKLLSGQENININAFKLKTMEALRWKIVKALLQVATLEIVFAVDHHHLHPVDWVLKERTNI